MVSDAPSFRSVRWQMVASSALIRIVQFTISFTGSPCHHLADHHRPTYISHHQPRNTLLHQEFVWNVF